jgi:eukaryotic-like serine/threonine-protein kinase
MACLERRRDAMDSAIAVLEETDGESLQHVVDVAHNLPSVGYCGRVEALAAEVPPPEDAEVARQVEALRQRLSRADALEHAGRYQDGIEVARAVAEAAEPLGYRPLRAEAALTWGRLVMNMRAFVEARELLDRAIREGLAAGMDQVAVEAMARRIYAARVDPPHEGETTAYLSLGQALGERIPDSAFVHALLFNNAGTVYQARGDREGARQHFERALAIKENAPQPLPIELVNIYRNLALVTSEEERRTKLTQDAIDEFARALGDNHPATLSARNAAGQYRSSPARAHELIAPACSGYERYHPERIDELTSCLFYLGLIEAELGHAEGAAGHMLHAIELLAGHDQTPSRQLLRDLARGHALLYRGDHEAALIALQAARDASLALPSQPWWIERRTAQARLGIGASALALGRRRHAVDVLEQALPVLERLVTVNENGAHKWHLARARATLAMALWPERPDDSARARRARELMALAERWYRDAGEGYERRLAELARWRSEHGMEP